MNIKMILSSLLVLALSIPGVAQAWNDDIPSENVVPQEIESKARDLMSDLEEQGFETSRGYFKLWTKEECDFTFEVMGLCYGNNPAAPYVALAVPPWPNEYVDEATSSVWGPSQPGYNDVYRLDPNEAIVILGQLPPPAAFFSEQTFLFTRQGTHDEESQTYQDIEENLGDFINVFFSTVPERPERIQSFASLSNPNNNVVIERQSGAAFDQIRYFIITPDRLMDQAVRNAFTDISVPEEEVFTEPIPSDMKVGLDEGADVFTTLLRYAHPDDGGAPGTASDTWRKDLPLVVLRVRTNPYPPVELEERTAVDERPLEPDLRHLLATVAQKWGQPCATSDCSDRAESFIDVQGFPVYLIGPECNEIGQNCLGDNWDAAYQLLKPRSLDDGQIYAVAGTLGTETGNATYVGLSVNQRSRLNGVANIPDEDLQGTASAYAGEVNNTDQFYLQYFTRDCSGLEELTGDNCYELSEDVIPQGDTLVLAVRDYIRPGTQRGPDSSLVLPSMVLELQRPDSPEIIESPVREREQEQNRRSACLTEAGQ